MGDDAIVGVTCKASYHLAMEAAEAGADYVAFGAYFPTATKETTTRAPLDLLDTWQSVATVPCVGDRRHHGGRIAGRSPPPGLTFWRCRRGSGHTRRGPAAAVRAYDAAIRTALAEAGSRSGAGLDPGTSPG